MKTILSTELLEKAKAFFRDEIVESHINLACKKASHLKEYNVNPFLMKYLANFLEGNDSPRSIAKALIYPRLLGTSVTTIFGNKTQRMVSEIFEGLGSAVPGIDIEFLDAIDGRKKYCQLKAGPNTINKDDIVTISGHFLGIKNLARVNNLQIGYTDLVVGVLYGTYAETSNHYKKIDQSYPVIVGKDFWHRLTGDEDFYLKLINSIGEVAFEVDGREKLEQAITILSKEVEESFKNQDLE